VNQPVAIVTGGGTGIGAAICRRLGKTHRVYVIYAHSGEEARAVAEAIVEAGGEASPLRADISQEEDVLGLFQTVKAEAGRVDVVINNAGIGHLKPVEQIDMQEYDHLFDTNARGTFMMCREAARTIEDHGRIINISTGATRGYAAGQALYVASKLAIEGYSKVLARELGPRGIAVNVVSPGMTDTPMLARGDADALRNYGARVAAMGRCGTPEDVADAVAALVSNDMRWVTGETISVSGGSALV